MGWVYKCDKCGSEDMAPVSYGYIESEAAERIVRREPKIIFGGCCISDEHPTHICQSCGAQWIIKGKTAKPAKEPLEWLDDPLED